MVLLRVEGDSSVNDKVITLEAPYDLELSEKSEMALAGISLTLRDPVSRSEYVLDGSEINIDGKDIQLTDGSYSWDEMNQEIYNSMLYATIGGVVATANADAGLVMYITSGSENDGITFKKIRGLSEVYDTTDLEVLAGGYTGSAQGSVHADPAGFSGISSHYLDLESNTFGMTFTVSQLSPVTIVGIENQGDFLGIGVNAGGNWVYYPAGVAVDTGVAYAANSDVEFSIKGSRLLFHVVNGGASVVNVSVDVNVADLSKFKETEDINQLYFELEAGDEIRDLKLATPDEYREIYTTFRMQPNTLLLARYMGYNNIDQNSTNGKGPEITPDTKSIGTLNNPGLKVHITGLELSSMDASKVARFDTNFIYVIHDIDDTYIGRDISPLKPVKVKFPYKRMPNFKISFRDVNNNDVAFMGKPVLTFFISEDDRRNF